MIATGVLVVTAQSARQWVGPHPAAVVLLRTMREVRNLGRILVANFSPTDLGYTLDAEVVKLPQTADAHTAVASLCDAGGVVCCHAVTPLISPSAIERCAGAVIDGSHAARTVVNGRGFVNGGGYWTELDVPTAVLGVTAFNPRTVRDFPLRLKPSQLMFVPVSRKEALSLAEPDDLEVIQALEYSGRI